MAICREDAAGFTSTSSPGLTLKLGDIDLASVDADVAMVDELARRRPRLGESEVIDDAVEPRFEKLEKPLARDAAFLLGDGEHAPELPFEQAVDVARLLLFVEADGVFRHLAARLRAVLAGREIAAFEGLAGAKNELAETAADASGGTDIAGHGRERRAGGCKAAGRQVLLVPSSIHPAHRRDGTGDREVKWSARPESSSDAAAFARAAAVVGHRRHVDDRGDFQADGLEGPDGGVAAEARTADADLDVLQAVGHGIAGGVLGDDLGGVRRRLARAAEVAFAGTRPGDDVALEVGHGDDRVVERGENVRQARW